MSEDVVLQPESPEYVMRWARRYLGDTEKALAAGRLAEARQHLDKAHEQIRKLQEMQEK
jgi:predicted translin family RNA/ssDNA-binding protein